MGLFRQMNQLSAEPPAILLKEFNSYMRKTRAYWNLSSIHFGMCWTFHDYCVDIPIAMEEALHY